MNLEPGRPVILYASKLMNRKRCIDLIDAHMGIAPGSDGKRPYLLIVGDGEERAMCVERVRAAGDPSVLFLGFQNQSQIACVSLTFATSSFSLPCTSPSRSL